MAALPGTSDVNFLGNLNGIVDLDISMSHRKRSPPRRVAKSLGIAVHDRIIVGKEGHASFKGLKLI